MHGTSFAPRAATATCAARRSRQSKMVSDTTINRYAIATELRSKAPWPVFPVTSSQVSRSTSFNAATTRQAIFASDMDYHFFRDVLVEASIKYGLAIHAYVWMTNHLHLLATPNQENSISKVFQSVGRKYVQYFNFTYKRSGTLWEGRYRGGRGVIGRPW